MTSADAAAESSRSKFDRQLVIVLLAADDDLQLLRQANALNEKHRKPALPSEVVTLLCKEQGEARFRAEGVDTLRRALVGHLGVPRPVSSNSRVYLLGRCSAAARTLAGWPADAVASLLADAGLREVAVISIVADEAARDPEREEHEQAEPGARSFASDLHRDLWEVHHIRSILHARTGRVHVLEESQARADSTSVEAGRKLTTPSDDGRAAEHHAEHSKVRLWWDGDEQRSAWAY